MGVKIRPPATSLSPALPQHVKQKISDGIWMMKRDIPRQNHRADAAMEWLFHFGKLSLTGDECSN